jgi:hypothetical protein
MLHTIVWRAVTHAVGGLWHLQKGDLEKAIRRYLQDIEDILQGVNEKRFHHRHIPNPLAYHNICVFKWNGQVGRARDIYS